MVFLSTYSTAWLTLMGRSRKSEISEVKNISVDSFFGNYLGDLKIKNKKKDEEEEQED